jgi:mannose PTS system EIIA component
MNNGILIIAHTPLASALRECALHVFPESATKIEAVDVLPNMPPEVTLNAARAAQARLGLPYTLVLTDMFGATPCNIAQKLIDGVKSRLIVGVNLPMLVRSMTYRHEPLDALVARALAGGAQGVMQVAVSAPQNQLKKKNDQDIHQHQQ